MPLSSFAAIESAVRSGWGADTCDPVDLHLWSPGLPSRGQCGVTAFVLHDVFGGQLLLADVTHADGSRQGVHWWNRLPGGLEVDLTRDQFVDGEVVHEPREFERPTGQPGRLDAQYALLRERVMARLEK